MKNDTNQIIAALRASYAKQRPLKLEEIFSTHTSLRDDPTTALDIIYADALAREDVGQVVDESDYCNRFPDLRGGISRQFQLHRALKVADAANDTAPGAAAETVETTRPPAPRELPTLPGFELLEVMAAERRAWFIERSISSSSETSRPN